MGFRDSSVHCLMRGLDLSLNPQLRKTQNQPPASSSLGHSPAPHSSPPPPSSHKYPTTENKLQKFGDNSCASLGLASV